MTGTAVVDLYIAAAADNAQKTRAILERLTVLTRGLAGAELADALANELADDPETGAVPLVVSKQINSGRGHGGCAVSMPGAPE